MQKKLTAAELDMVVNAKIALGLIPWSSKSEEFDYWLSAYEKLLAMSKHGTSDGKPWVEPPLTDEDAKQRPWVMVRDRQDNPWDGPVKLVYVSERDEFSFFTHTAENWKFARRATAEEIAAHTREEI